MVGHLFWEIVRYSDLARGLRFLSDTRALGI